MRHRTTPALLPARRPQQSYSLCGTRGWPAPPPPPTGILMRGSWISGAGGPKGWGYGLELGWPMAPYHTPQKVGTLAFSEYWGKRIRGCIQAVLGALAREC